MLCLLQGAKPSGHVAVSLRVAVLEGQLLQLFLDGVQPEKPRQRSKDL